MTIVMLANYTARYICTINSINQYDMKTNVGGFDGAFRTLLFIVLLLMSIMTGQWLWVLPGIIFFATAVMQWCPLYDIVGVNTHQSKA